MQTYIPLHIVCSTESHCLSPHLILFWLNCSESFVDSDVGWWMQKQIVAVPVACGCVLERTKFCTLGYGQLEGNGIALRCFMRAGLCLLCAVPCVFWSLLRVFCSLLTRVFSDPCSLLPALLRAEPPALRGCCALPICRLSPAPCPRAFPFLRAPSHLGGMPASRSACSLAVLFFSFFFFIFFIPFFPRPHGVTLTDFWWVAGSTMESAWWWWWFHCASDLQSIAEVPVMLTAVI